MAVIRFIAYCQVSGLTHKRVCLVFKTKIRPRRHAPPTTPVLTKIIINSRVHLTQCSWHMYLTLLEEDCKNNEVDRTRKADNRTEFVSAGGAR